MIDPLEKIIRPIVEGQIRGFLKEYPCIVEAVDSQWATAADAAQLTSRLAGPTPPSER